jgi:hypothetical protein
VRLLASSAKCRSGRANACSGAPSGEGGPYPNMIADGVRQAAQRHNPDAAKGELLPISWRRSLLILTFAARA